MAEFIEREVETIADWDLYCHFVAGLVGIGLSRLFAESGLEDRQFQNLDGLSNSMGLFLQKTNIIRDYLEDINEKRIFWPRAVWAKYAERLSDFKDQAYSTEAVWCLNDLISNALQHIPDCLEYMSRIRDGNDFNFCAIPQIMAIATLALCYQNHEVFTGVVKMKREDTMEIINSMNGMSSVFRWFDHYLHLISNKVTPSDPNRTTTLQAISKARQCMNQHARL